MAIELKQTVKMSQQLLITPQLQQAIKLLQLSRTELIETIQNEMLENPVLEEGNESLDIQEFSESGEGEDRPDHNMADMKTSVDGQDTPPVQENTVSEDAFADNFNWENYVEASQNSYAFEPRNLAQNSGEELPNYENIVTSHTTLHDHLEWQVHMGDYSEKEKQLCEEIIGNLDDNGYLQSPLHEIAEKTQYTLSELEDALCIIQDLDPMGVGATDLKECLTLQIRSFGADKKLLKEIIENHLPFIEKRDYLGLSKKMSITPLKAKELAEVIYSLEPKPGRRFAENDTQYVTPDVYVKKVGDDYVVLLNEDGLPKLQISKLYKNAIMKEVADRKEGAHASITDKQNEAQNYIQEKLKSALWLIKSIHQRQKTMYKVTSAIVKFQKEFLEQGVLKLKPLVLKEVAEEIGMHESTVSRATSGKYVHTPQGIFELKYFFNVGLSSESGQEDYANESIKQRVKTIVASEDLKAPLSDQAIAEILKMENVSIARRTVAKYREMLGILPSSRRKRLN